jgi:sugar (pentulose or hexulose) kinase
MTVDMLFMRHAAGGATKSDLWLQIHADVSNLPLRLTE